MVAIKTYKFAEIELETVRAYHLGKSWPVVYLIEDGKELYVGETTRPYGRAKEHLKTVDRQRLKRIHIVFDEEFNKSAALEAESSLIQYFVADGKYQLQNGNAGQNIHNYYDKQKYTAKIEALWDGELRLRKLAHKSVKEIKNSDLFKFSPYKSLTDDQYVFVDDLVADIKSNIAQTYIVHGKPGTGKTVLATYLIKYLSELEETKNLKIALVVPMTALRKTLKKVFQYTPGLKSRMVIGPADVTKEKYDILIVDESHRLKRRVKLGAAFKAFDDINKGLDLDKNTGTQLDWVLKSAARHVFFYDSGQNVMPSDVGHERFAQLRDSKEYTLNSQMRVKGGTGYMQFIEDFFSGTPTPLPLLPEEYDVQIFDDVCLMQDAIRRKDTEYGLCRIVAGYAWPWKSNPDRNKQPSAHDIEIGNCKLKWNSVAHDWVNSANAINEVGCIHTIQGYDLNYVAVIVGPELTYDSSLNTFVVKKEFYYDRNGHAGLQSKDELQRYILNIYKTLLTRGIQGTYIYIADETLRNRFKNLITPQKQSSNLTSVTEFLPVPTPLATEMVMVPLVGSAPCGSPILGEENIESEIPVETKKIRPGYQYFIIRADGDSMNLAGIEDGDLLLCKYGVKPETGERVVALLGGENVTVKYYDKKNGRRILLPKSTNHAHQSIEPEEGDNVIGVVQEVLKISQ